MYENAELFGLDPLALEELSRCVTMTHYDASQAASSKFAIQGGMQAVIAKPAFAIL